MEVVTAINKKNQQRREIHTSFLQSALYHVILD